MVQFSLVPFLYWTNEATAIATELGKPYTFQVIIRKHPNFQSFLYKDDDLAAFPLLEFWIEVKCAREEVCDYLWHPGQFYARLTSMRRLRAKFHRLGASKKDLRGLIAPSLDPFYDETREVLIGVAFLSLAPIYFALSVDDTIIVCDRHGDTVGDLRIEVEPVLITDKVEEDENIQAPGEKGKQKKDKNTALEDVTNGKGKKPKALIWKDEEVNLSKLQNEEILLSFHLYEVRGLPKKISASVFASFRFFV